MVVVGVAFPLSAFRMDYFPFGLSGIVYIHGIEDRLPEIMQYRNIDPQRAWHASFTFPQFKRALSIKTTPNIKAYCGTILRPVTIEYCDQCMPTRCYSLSMLCIQSQQQ